ncbi:hypothetical protein ACOSQ2_011112 [Xanthoceras sorbifolium]
MKHKETRPSFFKVLIGDFSNKLRIPPAFLKNFNGSSLGKIVLQNHSGENWVVEMEKDVNGLSFGSGWQEFVKDHALQVGDFLVFKYYGNSKFSVKIFGKTSCEKVKGLAKRKNDTNNGNQNQARDEIQECNTDGDDCAADNENEAILYSDQDMYGCLRSGKKRVNFGVDKPTKRSALSKVTVKSEMKNDHPTFCSKNENQNQARVRTQERKPENCEAYHEDKMIFSGKNTTRHSMSGKKHVINEVFDKPTTRSALSFKSENSCFIATYTDSNKYYMTIPREVARAKNLMTNKMVKLKDPSGRSWQVKLHIRPLDGRVDLKYGWVEFRIGNKLARNDALIFEFMQPRVMQVHIFREEGSRLCTKAKMFNAAKGIKIEAK